MFERAIGPRLLEELDGSPAVALLGPRQSGKTTLALEVGQGRPSLYLDLESTSDRARLDEPEAFLSAHQGELVILDEVHRVQGLFPVLRGLIDKARRKGRKHGLYLLLGSAGLDLLAQSGETLAGRLAYLELDRGEKRRIYRSISRLAAGVHRANGVQEAPGSAAEPDTARSARTRPLRSGERRGVEACRGEFQARAAKTRRAITSRLHATTLQCT